jgi:transcriptional regulator of acetoin/glycerol metabolism
MTTMGATFIRAVRARNYPPNTEEMRASLQRSEVDYRIDRDSQQAPWILTAPELSVSRAPVEELIAIAREDSDRLYSMVSRVGYALLFTSADGVVVDVRGDPARVDQFQYWGMWQGGVWSENVEGTNGIGTCIAEQRPVTVHRSQHFRARHAPLSCCGAPVFDPSANLVAVVDVSSCDPDISDRSHALAMSLTIDTAHAIEERLFRLAHHAAWVLLVCAPDRHVPLFLAVDDDERIVAADREARATLRIDSALVAAGTSLWHFFVRLPALFASRSAEASIQLTRVGDPQPWPVIATPPQSRLAPRLAPFHTRPRARHAMAKAPIASPLTPRERAVLQQVATGRSNKEIARLLDISPETVKSHLENVFTKLAVERRAQAIARAKDLGIFA